MTREKIDQPLGRRTVVDVANLLLGRQREQIPTVPVYDEDDSYIGETNGSYHVPQEWLNEIRSRVVGDGEVVHLIRCAFDGGRWR